MEYVQNLADTADIFLSHEGFGSSTPIPTPGVNGLGLKRRASDKYDLGRCSLVTLFSTSLFCVFFYLENSLYDSHPSGPPEWGDYVLPPSKRPHPSLLLATGTPQLYPTHPALFEYQNGGLHPHSEGLVSISCL